MITVYEKMLAEAVEKDERENNNKFNGRKKKNDVSTYIFYFK